MKSLPVIATLTLSSFILSAQVTLPPSGGNQRSEVTQYVGPIAKVTVVYNSPDVTSPSGEDRTGKIWGQLVPYGMNNLGWGTAKESPWRAGANENTTVTLSHDMIVEGQKLEAGTYGLHMIVKENAAWTVIFSKASTSWGSYFYNPEEDAIRVEVQPKETARREWLTYEFTDRQNDKCELSMVWEKKSVPIRMELIEPNEIIIRKFREDLRGSNQFTWQGLQAAAAFCARNNTNLDEALGWANDAIEFPFVGQENYSTLSTKSQVLLALGKESEADAVMKKAVDHPTATSFQIHAYGRRLISQGKPEKAMEVFRMNYKKYKAKWPTNVGMARGYSALGQYSKAVPFAKKALELAPDKLNKDSMTQAVEKLQKGEDIN